MQIVTVGDKTFIGTVESDKRGVTIVDSIQIATDQLTEGNYAKYLQAKNVGQLTNINVQGQASFQTRDLTAEEVLITKNLDGIFDQVKKTAIKQLENNYFARAIG